MSGTRVMFAIRGIAVATKATDRHVNTSWEGGMTTVHIHQETGHAAKNIQVHFYEGTEVRPITSASEILSYSEEGFVSNVGLPTIYSGTKNALPFWIH